MNHDESKDLIRLAGYVDRELTPGERSDVEAELERDATAQLELAAQRELCRQGTLWSRLTPPEPSDAAWARTLDRIHAALAPQTAPANYNTPKSHRWRWVAALSTAALVFCAVHWLPFSPNHGDAATLAGAFPVATAEDIEIVSIQGDDGVIVVGVPPLAGALDLATVGNTVLDVVVSDSGDGKADPSQPSKSNEPILVKPTDKGKATPVLP